MKMKTKLIIKKLLLFRSILLLINLNNLFIFILLRYLLHVNPAKAESKRSERFQLQIKMEDGFITV